MSQKKAQLLNPLNGNLNVTGVVTASSFVGGLTGSVTGNVTGTASTAQGLSGSPNITVGTITASGNVSVGGTLSYLDVTNIDSVGIVTAQKGIQVLANGLDITGFSTFKTGVSVTGVVTATSFSGDVNAATFDTGVGGVVITGVATATTFVGNLTGNVTGNTSGTAGGLTGTPDITVNNITGAAVTFSGDVQIPDKIKHTGDTTTAIRFPANNTVTVDTNGVERLRVDSTTGRLLLNTASTIASEPGEGHNPILQVAHVSGNVANLGISVSRFQASNPNSVPIILQKSRNSTIGSHTIVEDDDEIGRIEFAGSDGSNFRTAASITGEVDGTPGSSDMPGRLQFNTTADGATSATERLRIDSRGSFQFSNGFMSETVKINTTARNGTQAVNLDEGMVHYFSTNSAGTWKPNFTMSAGDDINATIATGDVFSPTMIVAKGATTHYATTIQVDGSDVTPEFSGGAPSDGGGSGTFDVYNYSIIKTGNDTFKAFAAVSTYE
jgi:hypothetical protein